MTRCASIAGFVALMQLVALTTPCHYELRIIAAGGFEHRRGGKHARLMIGKGLRIHHHARGDAIPMLI